MAKADAPKHDFEELRDGIASAFDAAEKPEPIEVVKSAKAEAVPALEEEAEVVEPAEGDQPVGEAVPEVKTEGEEGAEKEPAGSVEAPQNWSKADKETFKELPQKAQEFVLSRAKSMEADHTRKTMEIADFKKEYGAIDEMFSPYKQQMRASGHTPFSMVQAWMNVERALMDPAQREATIQNVAKAYNIDLGKFGGAKSATEVDPQQQEIDAFLSPYMSPLQKEIEALKAQLGQVNQFQTSSVEQQRNAEIQRLQTEVTNFATAKNDKGELAHPYFEDVQTEMARIANGYKAMNEAPPALEALYQMAVRANPSTYERLVAQNTAQLAAKQKEEVRAKAEKAKKAGSSVTGAPRGGQPKLNGADPKGIRGSLEAAFEEAMSR